MTRDEVNGLRYFAWGEKDILGKPIDWEQANAYTMRRVDELRHVLGHPIMIIRITHPHRPDAVDATAPTTTLSHVTMELMRLPGASWGVYTGNSFHIDTRLYNIPPTNLPARWMGIKPCHRMFFQSRGLGDLIVEPRQGVKSDWLYLKWNHPRSFEALGWVLAIAEKRIGI